MIRRFFAVSLVLLGMFAVRRAEAAEGATTLPSRTPRQTIEALVKATHNPDPAAYRSLFHTDGELEQQLLETMSDLVAASADFRNAAIKSFGEAETAKYNLSIEKAAMPLEAIPSLSKAEETIEGDTARVGDPASSKFIELKRVDGEWKIPLSGMVPAVKSKPDLIRQNMGALRGFSAELKKTASDVEKGHFRTAEEAGIILKLRLTKIHEQSGASDAPARSDKAR